jgi:hypothetical protein
MSSKAEHVSRGYCGPIMSFLHDNAAIAAALISGVISIVIAGCSGVFILIQSNRRIATLRKEILEERITTRFLEDSETYRAEFKNYEKGANELTTQNVSDHTALVQHLVDFFGETARHFYVENGEFLKDQELDRLLSEISSILSSGILNDHRNPNRMQALQTLSDNIVAFCQRLYSRTLAY